MVLGKADTSREIQTKDWRIHYQEAGEGHPVILLHGGGPGATGWSNFSPNIEALSQHFRVIAPDMPGWGESDPVDFNTLDHVDVAIQFLDALGIEKAAFVGNSMGGHTSIRMAAEHPERVSHLITMGPPLQMGPMMFGAVGLTEGLKIMYQGYKDASPEGMRRLVEIMVFDQEKFASDELTQERSDSALGAQVHLDNIIAAGPKAPIPIWVGADKAKISKITAPSLLIHGRDDRVVTFETTLFLAANIANSRAVLLSRCGHWAQLEHAAEFNRMVIDFVQHN
jgi:2-hydroxy-6-oxonona-2,4-dienedioate hydrolase